MAATVESAVTAPNTASTATSSMVSKPAAQHLLDLSARLSKIFNHLEHDTNDDFAYHDHAGRAYDTLDEVRHNISSVHSMLRSALGAGSDEPSSETSRQAVGEVPAAKAQEVFGIPLLADMILTNLNAKDILSVAQVCKTLSSHISDSGAMKRALGLDTLVDENDYLSLRISDLIWRTPFAPHVFKAISIRFGDEQLAEAFNRQPFHHISFEIRFGSNEPLPTIGARGRNMLLCQPLVKEMRVTTTCCDDSHYVQRVPGRGLPPLTSPIGITIGDILDATERLRAEHRLCPFARWHCHDHDGFIHADVKFHGAVSLLRSDPLFSNVRSRATPEEWAASREEIDRRRARFDGYIVAKGRAYYNNEPIPTLAEYQQDGSI